MFKDSTNAMRDIIELPKITDPRGNLSVIEGGRNIPFEVARVFWMYDVPQGDSRGGHAHKECHQFLVALRGGFDVVLDNGAEKRTIRLENPWQGVHIPQGVWADEKNFAPDSVCLVLASHPYDEADYIRDYEAFLEYKRG